MALLDFFKKKERRKKLEAKHVLPKISAAEEKKEVSDKTALGSSKSAGLILTAPRITEKTSIASESGVYVFKVARASVKNEIKRAVEELYKVEVDSVRVVNISSRRRRVGRKMGVKTGFKKAMVKLAPGQKIEFV